ncbi:hypothetical protein HK098_004210 [Nowakowskiella sp. JEL0407]|nr:hypothetical protein HK098_004210 [Nowakowskiella sp. JEL0407]
MFNFKQTFILTLFFILPLILASPLPSPASNPASQRYLVVYKKGTTASERYTHQLWLKLQFYTTYINAETKITSNLDFNSWQAYGLTAPPELAEKVKEDSVIDWVQPNQGFKISGQQITDLPGLKRISSRGLPAANAPYLFPDSAGSQVEVYVVDTGVKRDHPQFEGRVLKGISFIDDGIDGDGNGHGTHVAGIIASRDFGVAKKTTIIPVRVLDANGSGDTESFLKGLEFVNSAALSSSLPSVVNMSLDGPADRAVDQAVETVLNSGFIVVTAAGNFNQDACERSPARVSNAIAVGATDPRTDQMADFSNFGSCVAINAPGVGILSTFIGKKTGGDGDDFDTKTLDGTSMSCPHVTGVVALMLSKNPKLTAVQVKSALIAGATSGVLTVKSGTTDKNLFNGGVVGL